MKKTIVKNLLILSLAVGALVVIGNNVFANDLNSLLVAEISNQTLESKNGVLYGNSQGTEYCCCPGGNRSCAAADCAKSVCGEEEYELED